MPWEDCCHKEMKYHGISCIFVSLKHFRERFLEAEAHPPPSAFGRKKLGVPFCMVLTRILADGL